MENKFYELTEAFKQLSNLEPDDDIKECLDRLEVDIETKASNSLMVIRNDDLFVNGIDEEIKRLQALKMSAVKRADGFKEYIRYNMEVSGIQEIKTQIGTFKLRKSQSIEIKDESLIDEKYIRTVEKKSPDKKAIKDALKNGENVAGAVIKYNNNLSIK